MAESKSKKVDKAVVSVKMKPGEYYYGTGRRKSAIARVFLKKGKGMVEVNGKSIDSYFDSPSVRSQSVRPLSILGVLSGFDVKVNVYGGGKSGQAGAMSLGIARAIIEYDADKRPELKKVGLLTRDARVVERKKVGKPKARKSAQFSKR